MSSNSWKEFFERLERYGEIPTWGWFGKAPKENLEMSREDQESISGHGRSRLERAKFAYEKIERKRPGLLPKTPKHLDDHLEKLHVVWLESVVGEEKIKSFWAAITFDVADYSCAYCGRSTFEVYEEENHRRGLFLTVDHYVPKAQGGDEWNPSNLRCACWSCNHIKGRLSKEAFKVELRSLAKAVMERD